MGVFVDISGQQHGRLTAIKRVEDYVSPKGSHIARWLCKCDCGKEIIILRNTWNRVQSCGCIRAEKAAATTKIKPGQRYGKWAVIKSVPLDKTYANGLRTGWLCRCDCGTERVVTAKSLTSGESRSCGCVTFEKAAQRLGGAIGMYEGTMISKITQTAPTKANKTGVRGVSWSNREKKYIARIGLQNKTITLGRFDTLEEAAAARKAAERKYYDPIIEEYKKEESK